MSNHIYLIWQVGDTYDLSNVRHSFMKYTAQMLLKKARTLHPAVLAMFKVKAADRKHQIWKRNPLPVPLWSKAVFEQKLGYSSEPAKSRACGSAGGVSIFISSVLYDGEK